MLQGTLSFDNAGPCYVSAVPRRAVSHCAVHAVGNMESGIYFAVLAETGCAAGPGRS